MTQTHTNTTGRTDLVDAVLRLMSQLPPSLGGPLAPDVVTYNSLLTAVTARGETQKAEAMLADMMGGCVYAFMCMYAWKCGGRV